MKWIHGVTLGLLALAVAPAYAGSPVGLTPPQSAPVLAIEDVAVVDVRQGRILADPIASRERTPYLAVMTEEDFRATQEGVAPRRRLVQMLHEEGAGILVGTDRSPWGFAFHWEMQELVRAGLDPSTVLRAATLDAAIYLGKEQDFGSVEVGRRADLVLLEANPLEDIRNAGRIEAVILGGDVFDPVQLEAMVEDGCEVLNGAG